MSRKAFRRRMDALDVLDRAEDAGLTLVPQDDGSITMQQLDGTPLDPVLAQEIGRYERELHRVLTAPDPAAEAAQARAQARAVSSTESPTTDPGDDVVGPAPLRTPAHGRGRLRVGNPGATNRGRTRADFRRKMREIATDEAALEQLKAVARGGNGAKPRESVAALRTAAEYGGLKPPEELRLKGLLAKIDMNHLPDAAISRLAAGEHPLAVLASVGLLPAGEAQGDRADR